MRVRGVEEKVVARDVGAHALGLVHNKLAEGAVGANGVHRQKVVAAGGNRGHGAGATGEGGESGLGRPPARSAESTSGLKKGQATHREEPSSSTSARHHVGSIRPTEGVMKLV